jgi:hypothetical protein
MTSTVLVDRLDARRGRTILTRTGRLVRPLHLLPCDVDLIDIAWALSGEGRFTNHTCATYSVGQHSVQMARWALDFNYGWSVAYQCLLHDSPEAYLGDVATPVKELYPDYREVEDRTWGVIAGVLQCPPDLDPRVKELDRLALRTELRDLMPDYVPDGPSTERPEGHPDMTIRVWDRKHAFQSFVTTYQDLRPVDAPPVDIKKFIRVLSGDPKAK